MLADHVDGAGRRAAAIIGTGRTFNHFNLFGIEGIARHAANIANAVDVNAVRGIGPTHINRVTGGGVAVFTGEKCAYARHVL
ncbi:hypothetical protein D3C81_1861450 [compost metagenome]